MSASALDAASSFGGRDYLSQGEAAWVADARALEAQGLDSGSALLDALRYVERDGERLATRYQTLQAEVAWLEHTGAPAAEVAALKALLEQLSQRPSLSSLEATAETPRPGSDRGLGLDI